MSSLVAYTSNNQFFIATDTLAHEKSDDEIRPLNFCSKTIYLPHVKCCFAGQGISNILNQFFVFVQEKVIAKDLYSLLTQATRHFKANTDPSFCTDQLATLFLFGFNDTSCKLEVHKITITKSAPNKNEQVQLGLLHKPEIIGIDEILQSIVETEINELLIKLMIEQKRQDDLKPPLKRAGIGGRIQITTMLYEENTKELLFQIKLFDFHDFDETYEALGDSQNSHF